MFGRHQHLDLIDEYGQQYNGVKDKLNDLIQWVQKMPVSLAEVNPDGDCDGVERRSELAKSSEDIEARSLALLEKGKIAWILDKAQGTGEVIKLIEQLGRAIK